MSLRHSLLACASLFALAFSPAARGQVISLSVSPSSQTVLQGVSGYVLEFSMITTGPIDLGSFNVTVTVPTSSGISFNGGTNAVNDYVFANDLSGLFLFNNPIDDQSGDISDVPNALNLNLAAGTHGLGRMYFSVAPNAPLGTVNITLDGATSFTEGVSPFGAHAHAPTGGTTIGTLTIAPVPEPSMLPLAVVSVAAGVLVRGRKR